MDNNNLLTKEDIDVRVAQTSVFEGPVKANLLLYKDARVDMFALDKLYGPMGWKRSHRMIGDRLYCTVSVWDKDKKEWIEKEDVGTESNTEPEKGQASDSFKRACFNWGIGRELYTAPKISIELKEKEYGRDNGKVRVYASFKVSEIGYDENRTINKLVIVDRFGNVRYSLGETSAPVQKAEAKPAPAKKATAKPKAEAKPTETNPKDYLPGGKYYAAVIERSAKGQPTKSGEPMRDFWVRTVGANADMLEAFDHDVATYRLNNHISPVF